MSKNSKAQTVEDLQRCLRSVHTWLAQNGLALNPDKTEVLGICPIWQQGTEALIDVLDVAGVNIKPVEKVKLLGVSLDHRLDYGPHVKNVCANSFYHIRALKHIRRSINKECANEIACAIVNTRLDYCNSLFWGTSQSNIIALQRVQNAAARIVVCAGLRDLRFDSFMQSITQCCAIFCSRSLLTKQFSPIKAKLFTITIFISVLDFKVNGYLRKSLLRNFFCT